MIKTKQDIADKFSIYCGVYQMKHELTLLEYY